MLEKFSKNLIVAVIIVGIVIAGVFLYLNQEETSELSPEEVAEKAVDFINQNILTEGSTASLAEVTEEGSVYKIKLKIGDQEFDSYLSKDGKFLFPEGIKLEEEFSGGTPNNQPETPDEEGKLPDAKLETLAKCLSEKGTKFYGAYWCGWCARQKEAFGEAAQYLPYIECIDEETQETTLECREAGITSFPTWEFEGERNPGFKNPEELAELSGCSL